MQVLNLDAELNISRLDADIRTLRLGEGGTTNYNDLTNKPSINSVTLTGNKTTSDLNIKTSDLVNDAGFITNADIPTKTSDLINDDGFQTAAQVSTAVAAAIPTEVSAFTNDAGYITAAQVGNIPTKTSDLDNDSGFITSAQAPVQSVNGYTGAVNLVASDIEVSSGVTVADDLSTLASSIPTKTSELDNDSGFITSLNVPSKTSDLVNDSGFVTNQIDDSTTADATTWSSDKIVSYIASIPKTATITDTPIASFTDGADNVPVSSLIVDIDAVQSGSGTPSPDNVRPISGHSTCTIKVNDDIDVPQTEITTAIALGTTVYGGALNVTTGELIIDKTFKTCDGSEVWQVSGSGASQIFYLLLSDMKSGLNLNGISNYIPTGNDTGTFCIRFGYNSSYLFIYQAVNTLEVSDLASFKTYLSNNPLELCYPLATPTTVQLTPTEVRTLLGNNNIFADTGNINELVYFKTGCEALARLIEAYT